jgi:tRNA pseudouridine synthase 10
MMKSKEQKREPKSRFLKLLEEDSKLKSLAKKLVTQNLCDHCLGRQTAQVCTGMTNRERGELARKFAGGKEPKECAACSGLFKQLESIADKAARQVEGLEFKTFLVGSRMPEKLVENEEKLWQKLGINYCEPMKSEFNRELGKVIFGKLKGRSDMDKETPDLVFLVDLETDKIQVKVNSLFVYGKYRKLVRGLPQTKWDKYKETVEDIIAKPFMEASGGRAHAMHGMGREDIDARCLDGRPFVFEIIHPVKRELDLRKIQRLVNKSKKVQVTGLKFSCKKEVRALKACRPDKTYRLLVEFESEPKTADLRKLLSMDAISQKTPQRVLHRRADLVRRRRVKGIKWRKLKLKRYEFVIKGEAGLYVKELVTGDCGRTVPSISGILAISAKVISLDVIKIHLEQARPAR